MDRAFVTERAVWAERRILASMRDARGAGKALGDADAVEARLGGTRLTKGQKEAVRTVLLSKDMLDRALPFDLAQRGVDRHELAVGHDARQQDGDRLAVLAAAGIDGDESAGANHVTALGRHGNVGDAAGHGSVSPAVARRAARRPRNAPGGSRPLSPVAAARRADSRGPTAAGGTNAVERLSGPRRGVRHCEDAADLQQGLADNGRVAMVGEVPVRVCLDEPRDSTEPGAAQALARERRIALLGTAGVASGLVAVAVDGQDGDRRRGLELFEALIELARMDEANRGRLGARFLEEAATSIDGLALLDGIEPAVTHGLTMAYVRADVEAPEALVERLNGQIGPLRESGRLRQAFEKQMGNAEAEA